MSDEPTEKQEVGRIGDVTLTVAAVLAALLNHLRNKGLIDAEKFATELEALAERERRIMATEVSKMTVKFMLDTLRSKDGKQ